MMISVLAIMMVSSKCLNGWREVHSLAFAARRADCAAASSSQAHRRAAVSRRRRLDGEGARRATITWAANGTSERRRAYADDPALLQPKSRWSAAGPFH